MTEFLNDIRSPRCFLVSLSFKIGASLSDGADKNNLKMPLENSFAGLTSFMRKLAQKRTKDNLKWTGPRQKNAVQKFLKKFSKMDLKWHNGLFCIKLDRFSGNFRELRKVKKVKKGSKRAKKVWNSRELSKMSEKYHKTGKEWDGFDKKFLKMWRFHCNDRKSILEQFCLLGIHNFANLSLIITH